MLKIEPGTRFSYRKFLKARKPYPSITLGELHDGRLAELFEPSSLRSGETGIYLGVYPTLRIWGSDPFDYDDKKWIWLIFDIDGVEKGIPSAIERANRICDILKKSGLIGHTHWILSGTGLKCVFDFLIDFSQLAAWLEYLDSLKRDEPVLLPRSPQPVSGRVKDHR